MYAVLCDALFFIKNLTAFKILNSFKLRFSYCFSAIFNTYWHIGYPESLSIEPAAICNLKCPECSVTIAQNKSGNKQFLSIVDYKNIIDQVYRHLVYLQLFFQGEPFLNNSVFDMIKYASHKNIYTSISTNGHFLSQNNCNKIIESGLNRIIISLDATTADVYSIYRVGGNFEKVVLGITELVKAKLKKKSAKPFVELQMVVFSTNEHQIPEFINLSRKLGADGYKIKSAQINNLCDCNKLVPKNRKYARYVKNSKGNWVLNRNQNFKCKRVWFSMVINTCMQALPCCFDKNSSYSYGNVKNNINLLFKSVKAKQFRQAVWGNYKQIPECLNCTEGLKNKIVT